MPEQIDPDLKKAFVNALLNCKAMRDHGTRKLIINELQNKIGTDFDRFDNDRAYVMGIVERCMNYPLGIEKLVDEMHFYEGNPNAMKQVFKLFPFIGSFSEVVEDPCLISYLFMLLFETKKDENFWKEAYEKSLPKDYTPRDFVANQGELTSFLFSIKRLCDFPETQKPHPVITFADHVAEQYKSIAPKLMQWKKDVRSKYNLSSDSIKTPGITHLLLKIDARERGDRKKRTYAVTRYVWAEPGGWAASVSPWPEECLDDLSAESVINDTELICSWDDLPKVLNLAVSLLPFEFAKSLKAVELFLPKDMLDLDVDAWPIEKEDEDEIEMTFGEEYAVWFRLLQRMNLPKPQYLGKWEQRWRHIEQGDAATHAQWVSTPSVYEPKALYKRLNGDDQAACLVASFWPDDQGHKNPLSTVLYQAGIPVALIYRPPENVESDPEKAIEAMKSKLLNQPLADLPNLIKDWRNNPGDAQNPGHHLTLIWDNPNRMPDQTPYAEPASRG